MDLNGPGRGNRGRGRGGPGRPERRRARTGRAPVVQKLMELNGLGAETVARLETEAFYRSFDNRRQLAAFGGLAGTPWKSGSIDHEQGVSMGNHRLRETMIQLAWLWLLHQPNSALTLWYPRADQGRDQAAEEEDGRRAGAQAAGGAVAIRRRRRCDRGRQVEARRPGALEASARSERFFTNPPGSDQPRSIRVGEPGMDCLAQCRS